jgi:hypothetical protein
MTLPANELSATSFPFMSFRVKFRFAGVRFASQSVGPAAAAADPRTVAMASTVRIDRVISVWRRRSRV